MAEIAISTFAGKSPLHQRIMAKLQVHVSWKDETNGKSFSVYGTTENVGETSALINVDILPKVGSNVKICLMDDDSTVVETSATVIRVERDPSKPQAALSILKNLKEWKDKAMTAAQAWVSRDIKLNYVDDGWLN